LPLFDLSPDPAAMIGPAGDLLRVNDAMVAALGYGREELVGTPFAALVHPDDVDAMRVALDHRAGPETRRFEARHRHKTGEYRIMDWTGRHQDGDVLLGVGRDVTECRAIEADHDRLARQFAAAVDRLALATHAAGVGVWDWDVVANVLTWDDQMFRLYGVEREAFSGAYEAWVAGLHPDDVAPGQVAV